MGVSLGGIIIMVLMSNVEWHEIKSGLVEHTMPEESLDKRISRNVYARTMCNARNALTYNMFEHVVHFHQQHGNIEHIGHVIKMSVSGYND